MLFESLNRTDVREFLQQLLIQDRYKKINPPEGLNNNYCLEGKYAFFLAIDALCKFEQIIADDDLVDEYIAQLSRIFKKFNEYSDIKRGIYTLIIKIVSVKLNITNHHLAQNKEKILIHIYDKYIVNGYFYYGLSSNHINEITFVGLRRDGFSLDSKLITINELLTKYGSNKLFTNSNTMITDDIVIAFYQALLYPDYLCMLASSKELKDGKYNKDCFYTKNITEIKENILKISKRAKLNNQDQTELINFFIDVFDSDNISKQTPCIALINRSALNKNQLKDIEEIIKNEDQSLTSAVSLILESRYNSYELKEDILPFQITIKNIPSYNEFILGKSNFAIINKNITLDKDSLKVEESTINKNVNVNSYGAVSIAIIGITLIIIGLILSFILQIIGR